MPNVAAQSRRAREQRRVARRAVRRRRRKRRAPRSCHARRAGSDRRRDNVIASGGAATRSGSMIGSRGTPPPALNATPLTRMSALPDLRPPARPEYIVVSDVIVTGATKPGRFERQRHRAGRRSRCRCRRPAAPRPPGAARRSLRPSACAPPRRRRRTQTVPLARANQEHRDRVRDRCVRSELPGTSEVTCAGGGHDDADAGQVERARD